MFTVIYQDSKYKIEQNIKTMPKVLAFIQHEWETYSKHPAIFLNLLSEQQGDNFVLFTSSSDGFTLTITIKRDKPLSSKHKKDLTKLVSQLIFTKPGKASNVINLFDRAPKKNPWEAKETAPANSLEAIQKANKEKEKRLAEERLRNTQSLANQTRRS